MPEFVFRFGPDVAGRAVKVYDQSGQLAHSGTAGSAVAGEVEYTATLSSGIYTGEVQTVAGPVRALGVLDATSAELSATYVARGETELTMPSAFATAWGAAYALSAFIQNTDRPGRKKGRASLDLLATFNAASTAYSAPTNTYYVAPTGNDSTGNGTSGTPWRSIWKAVEAANTSGSPAKIVVTAGDYNRNYSFTYGSGGTSAVVPTVDIALVARGGQVRAGTPYDPSLAGTPYTFAFDGTYINVQVNSAGTVNDGTWDRITDRLNLTGYGRDTILTKVADFAACNATPNSWAHNGAGKVGINRADRRTVTTATARLMPSMHAFRMTSQVNVAILPETDADSWIIEGGNTGTINLSIGAPSGTNKVFYAKNVTMRACGGAVNTGDQRGVSVDSWNGLVAFENCATEDNLTDGFNARNSNAATAVRMLAINCTGRANGKYPSTSCNGITGHDNVLIVDIAGWYDRNNGGSMAHVNTVKAWHAGSRVTEDHGDVHHGGTIPPTAVYTRDTAEAWLDQCDIDMPNGTDALNTKTSTAKIHHRDCLIQGTSGGVGTVDTY